MRISFPTEIAAYCSGAGLYALAGLSLALTRTEYRGFWIVGYSGSLLSLCFTPLEWAAISFDSNRHDSIFRLIGYLLEAFGFSGISIFIFKLNLNYKIKISIFLGIFFGHVFSTMSIPDIRISVGLASLSICLFLVGYVPERMNPANDEILSDGSGSVAVSMPFYWDPDEREALINGEEDFSRIH